MVAGKGTAIGMSWRNCVDAWTATDCGAVGADRHGLSRIALRAASTINKAGGDDRALRVCAKPGQAFIKTSSQLLL